MNGMVFIEEDSVYTVHGLYVIHIVYNVTYKI